MELDDFIEQLSNCRKQGAGRLEKFSSRKWTVLELGSQLL